MLYCIFGFGANTIKELTDDTVLKYWYNNKMPTKKYMFGLLETISIRKRNHLYFTESKYDSETSFMRTK